MKPIFCNQPIALANAHDIKDAGGKFSKDLRDAVVAAHATSADAHDAGPNDWAHGHAQAARLHRKVAEYARRDGRPEMAAVHEGIAKGHEAMGSATPPGNQEETALPNDALPLSLGNDAAIDAEGWCLIGPFGEWPKTRYFRAGGQVREQRFIQVLDNAAADTMVADFNGLVGRVKRFISAVPVYKGHGDLNDIDPDALANDTAKVKLGTVDQIRKSARGIEAHFNLDNDGQSAVASGCKYPSGFWYVLPNGQRAGATLCQPFKLISVALTPTPNIPGVESLANAGGRPPQPQPQAPSNLMFTSRITGLLISHGRPVPENPSEDQVFNSLALALANGGEVTDDQADMASGKAAFLASSRATDQDGHSKAAALHMKAAVKHQEAGNAEAEQAHTVLAKYHTKCVNM